MTSTFFAVILVIVGWHIDGSPFTTSINVGTPDQCSIAFIDFKDNMMKPLDLVEIKPMCIAITGGPKTKT